MGRMIVRHVHSSSRYDRKPITLWRALRLFMAQFFGLCNLLTFTEMSNNKRAAMLRWLGWGTAQIEHGPPGADECAAMFSKWVWTHVMSDTIAPSRMGLRSRGGQRVYVLHVVLMHKRSGELLHVYVVHMPVVRDPMAWEIWEDNAEWLGRQAAKHNADSQACMATGDFNRRFHLAGHRRQVLRFFPENFRLNWEKTPLDQSSKYDGTVTNLEVVSTKEMPLNDSSDHRPFKEVLRK